MEKFRMLKSRKAQIGSTLTWVISIVIVIMVMFLYLALAGILSLQKGNNEPLSDREMFRAAFTQGGSIEYSLANFITQTTDNGESVYDLMVKSEQIEGKEERKSLFYSEIKNMTQDLYPDFYFFNIVLEKKNGPIIYNIIDVELYGQKVVTELWQELSLQRTSPKQVKFPVFPDKILRISYTNYKI
jgi:hypothetical protein